jgi:dipeptidyl-peptidase-3
MSQSEFVVPKNVPYFPLEVREAFNGLTPQQRLYAHHMAWAGWQGTATCASQLSQESLTLLRLFFTVFHHNTVAELRAAASQVPAEEVDGFLQYVAMVYSSMGNYLSFGDSKFIPSCSKENFQAIIQSAKKGQEEIQKYFSSALVEKVYSLSSAERTLSFDCSAYYGEGVNKADIELVDAWRTSKGLSPENTRIFKAADGTLELRIAAAVRKEGTVEEFQGKKVKVVYGDHHESMVQVAASLSKAGQYVANDTQRHMIDSYVQHFVGGSIEDHKQSQRFWVKDQGPAVETNIGFIESYRDPAGVRAEWEGFVAVVNKHQSIAYGQLVDKGPQFIELLPWGKAFELERFTKPDFTALEVLGFASSGLPAGICIPNYDDVRKEEGFKNVYLANVVAAMSFKEKANHYTDSDWEIFKRKFAVAYPVNVGIHELLGHGTGKLLTEDAKGQKNFDPATTISPIDGKPVQSWYKPGETWSSVFKGISNAYEECRAEAVALYLCVVPELLTIFGQTTAEDQQEAIHIIWLNMIRAGMVGLEFYNPEKKQWLQAHMRARFAILQTLLRAPNSIVSIQGEGEGAELTISIDRSRIATDGRKAIGDLLVHLNVYKSTADAVGGTNYFEGLTVVDDRFVKLREKIMSVKKPRRQLVQPHTRLNEKGDDAVLIDFEGSVEGVIQSMVTRHRDIPLI